jgi:hypothetical protein
MSRTGDHDDVDGWMRRRRDESIVSDYGCFKTRCECRGPFENRGNLGPVTRHLGKEMLGRGASRKGYHAEMVQMLIDDVQCLAADRSCRSKHGNPDTAIATL